MITYNISCDICRKSSAFSLGTLKKTMRESMYRIKKKDICSNCVTLALYYKKSKIAFSDETEDFLPMNIKIVTRNLTKKEKLKVYNYYYNKK